MESLYLSAWASQFPCLTLSFSTAQAATPNMRMLYPAGGRGDWEVFRGCLHHKPAHSAMGLLRPFLSLAQAQGESGRVAAKREDRVRDAGSTPSCIFPAPVPLPAQPVLPHPAPPCLSPTPAAALPGPAGAAEPGNGGGTSSTAINPAPDSPVQDRIGQLL